MKMCLKWLLLLELFFRSWCASPDYAARHVVQPYKLSKVLHLGQDQRMHRSHIDDRDYTKNTYLNYKTKGAGGIRINADYPLKIPDKFTWCATFKSTRWTPNWGGRIGLVQMGTTTHGESVVKDFLNPNLTAKGITDEGNGRGTYQILFGILINGDIYTQHLHLSFGNQLWHLSTSELAAWNKWESACFGIDTAGKAVIYRNGELFDDKVFENEKAGPSLQKSLKNSHFDTLTATDIWVGYYPINGLYESTFGHITNVHMFNRILSHDDMVSMTDCSWSPLPTGRIFTWEEMDTTWHGTYYPWVNVPNDIICPDLQQSAGYIYLPGPAFSFEDAHYACKVVGGKLLTIETEEEFQTAGVFMRYLTEDYINRFWGNLNYGDGRYFTSKYANDGGGIETWVNYVRNRTANDNTDPFYNQDTGQQNRFLRWWGGWNTHPTHELGWAIYIRGVYNTHIPYTAEWMKDK